MNPKVKLKLNREHPQGFKFNNETFYNNRVDHIKGYRRYCRWIKNEIIKVIEEYKKDFLGEEIK